MFRIFIPLFILLFIACSSNNEDTIQNVDSLVIAKDGDLLYKQKDEDSNLYYVGFDLRGEPQEDIAQYLPLLKYLEKSTKLHFKILITPKTSSSEEELCLNHTQISIMGALSLIKAHVQCDADVLVRGLNQNNKASYQSMFITKLNSPINSIDDVKGVRFAFGDKDSTQGHLIPRQILNKHHIKLDDFKSYKYAGSHQKCAELVLSGDYDVCALQDTLAKDLVDQKLVKIIYASPFYSSSLIAVNRNLPDGVSQKIKKALIDFKPRGKDRKNLYHWENTEMPLGFTQGKFSDYSDLHEIAKKLGMINESKSSVK